MAASKAKWESLRRERDVREENDRLRKLLAQTQQDLSWRTGEVANLRRRCEGSAQEVASARAEAAAARGDAARALERAVPLALKVKELEDDLKWVVSGRDNAILGRDHYKSEAEQATARAETLARDLEMASVSLAEKTRALVMETKRADDYQVAATAWMTEVQSEFTSELTPSFSPPFLLASKFTCCF